MRVSLWHIPFRISVKDVDTLELRVLCPGTNDYAWAMWVDPFVLVPLSGQGAATSVAGPSSTGSKGKIHPALGYELKKHPVGQKIFKFRNHWYLGFSDQVTWQQAQERCKSMGGYLACLETPQELKYVEQMIKRSKEPAFVGGYYKGRNWYWLTGKQITTANWDRSEPNNLNSETCIAIGIDGKWNNLPPATHTAPFICEWDF